MRSKWIAFKPESPRKDTSDKVWAYCVPPKNLKIVRDIDIRAKSETIIMWPCGDFVFQNVGHEMGEVTRSFHVEYY